MELIDIFMSNIATTLLYMRLADYLDIAIVAYVIFQLIRFVKKSRAAQLLKGIVIILLLLFVSEWFKLIMVNYILINAVQVGLIAVIVLFQPEFRRALEQMGRSKIGGIVNFTEVKVKDEEVQHNCRAIADAVAELSREKLGCLIIIERRTKLDDIASTGILTDACISKELLLNIFIKDTPLHDGAVVVQDLRIKAAACILPLTQNNQLDSQLGTRHRAAIGMSESADCICIITSEETGTISIALDGNLTRHLTPDVLYKRIYQMLKPVEKKHVRRPRQKKSGKSEQA